MGLLEKAMKYKSSINSKGEETLIDKITGPAETEMLDDEIPGIGQSTEVNTLENSNESDVQPVIDNIDTDSDEDILILEDDDLVEIDETSIPAENQVSSSEETEEEIFAKLEDEDVSAIDFKTQDEVSESNRVPVKDETFDHADGQAAADKETAPDESSIIDEDEEEAIKDFEETVEKYSDLPGLNKARGSFNDFMVLYEMEKEISKADTAEKLFDVILFSLMGQIGASSSSIVVNDVENDKWIIAESRGVTVDIKGINFDSSSGIMKQLGTVKKIINIKDFQYEQSVSDDYQILNSLDAKLLIPLLFAEKIVGIIILGGKLISEDYNDAEMDFLNFIKEVSGIALSNINLRNDLVNIRDADKLQDKIISETSIEKVEIVVQNEFKGMGIESYALFIKNKRDDSYIPILAEKEDFLQIKEAGLSINKNNSIIKQITNAASPVIIDDFHKSDIINKIFSSSQIKKMSIFRVYPFAIGNILSGFLVIFRIAESVNLLKIDQLMQRIARFIISYLINMLYLDQRDTRYIDNVEVVVKRIEDNISNAKNLEIPLTMVLFSIKNYKRYYNLYGYNEVKNLLKNFERIIIENLFESDFSVRYDRHKILIVLPGKNKKYALPLANTIRNEIVHRYSKKEMQLLVTFLTAEYPEDGEDFYSLIAAVD